MTNPTQPDLQIASVDAQTAQPTSPDPYAAVELPENSLVSAAQLSAWKQTAAQCKLPAQVLAQWLACEQTRLQQQAQQQAHAHTQQLAAWAQQTQQLFGPTWQEEVSKAVRAADALGGPELRTLLEETGLGNHPVIVRTFHTVATHLSEDHSCSGAAYAPADKTFAQALYGKN